MLDPEPLRAAVAALLPVDWKVEGQFFFSIDGPSRPAFGVAVTTPAGRRSAVKCQNIAAPLQDAEKIAEALRAAV